MKRIELNANYGEFQADSIIEIEDAEAAKLVHRGRGKPAAQQHVYNHIDEMPLSLQQKSVRALEAADKAGGYRDQTARAAATAPFREK